MNVQQKNRAPLNVLRRDCFVPRKDAMERGTVQITEHKDFLSILPRGIQQGGCVYIMTNQYHNVLYVGVSSDLIGRVWDHKNKTYPNSFTAKYNCNKLVYYEFYPRIEEAIAAEKALKGGNKKSKLKLINSMNPTWIDLYDDLLNK